MTLDLLLWALVWAAAIILVGVLIWDTSQGYDKEYTGRLIEKAKINVGYSRYWWCSYEDQFYYLIRDKDGMDHRIKTTKGYRHGELECGQIYEFRVHCTPLLGECYIVSYKKK